MSVGGFKTFHFWKHGDNNKQQKVRFPKSKYSLFFSPFNEMQFLLPLRGPFPAQLSSWAQGRFSSSNLLQPDSPVAGPVCFSGDLMSSSLPGFSLFPFVPPRKSDLLGVSGVAESWPGERKAFVIWKSPFIVGVSSHLVFLHLFAVSH